MKPFVIFALWAFVGWDVGAWAQAFLGIPSVAGILVGVAIGAAFAIEARRRIAAAVQCAPQTTVLAQFGCASALDRAA